MKIKLMFSQILLKAVLVETTFCVVSFGLFCSVTVQYCIQIQVPTDGACETWHTLLKTEFSKTSNTMYHTQVVTVSLGLPQATDFCFTIMLRNQMQPAFTFEITNIYDVGKTTPNGTDTIVTANMCQHIVLC